MIGIMQRPRKVVLLYSVRLCCIRWRYILETRVGAIVEEHDFQQCGLCSKLYSSWLSLLVLYSTLLPNVLTFALKLAFHYLSSFDLSWLRKS